MVRIWITTLSLLLATFVSAQQDGWQMTVKNQENYTGIVLANGRIGILPTVKPFGVEHVILNHVFDRDEQQGVSRVLQGMNFGNLEMEIDGELITQKEMSNWSQTFDLKAASLTTSFQYRDKAQIAYTIYALRNVPYAGYIDVVVEATEAIQIKVAGGIETPVDYTPITSTFKTLRDLESTLPILQTVASSPTGKHKLSASATFVWHDLNSTREKERPALSHVIKDVHRHQLVFEQTLDKGAKSTFAWTGAVCTSQDFDDPQSESERFVIFNLLTPKADLLAQHLGLWDDLWQGDIEIEGDLEAQHDVRLALYHLYAFGREDADLSIAPMGLSAQGYNGHVFWDAELWMFPPLALLNQGIAKSMVNYRYDRLAVSQRKAVNFGYQGAMYAWESDDTGEESTPTWALTGTFEHHVTADVAIACWNYYRVAGDQVWLREKGYPVIKAVADFWTSRVTKNTDGSYSIKNVIGANEYAHNVTDNAFTNGAAITALQVAVKAAKVLGEAFDPQWKTVAENIKLHRFQDGTTMEHEAYAGETIKQADVNLLAYPLEIITDQETIQKDLNYYEPKVIPGGPAMANSIFSVLYARLGDAKNAYCLFKASYQGNKRPPFGALAESTTSNNPYFATGAGGMLQAVLFGFGGLRLTDQGIIQKDPILPKQWKSLTLKGIGASRKTFKIN